MQRGTTVMDKPLWVKFSEEERKERVDALLRQLDRVEELRESKSAADAKFKAQIEEALDEARRLRAVLRDDGRQMTLADAKVDDVPAEPSKEEATEALAEVAKRAERPAPRFHKRGELCTSDTCTRPRCNYTDERGVSCGAVLNAEEVEGGYGVCFACEQRSAPGMEHDSDAEEAEAEA